MKFIGCDVSKLTLDLVSDVAGKKTQLSARKFDNQPSGWAQLMHWAEDCCQVERADIGIVMEATGVYHLPVAAYLANRDFKVQVCNPGRAADYARSQNRLNKSDKLDAHSLKCYGAALQKTHWFQPNTPQISQLKSLLSLLDQLGKDELRWQNRLEKATFQDAKTVSIPACKRQLKNLHREQQRTQDAIDHLVHEDEELQHNQQLMCSIKGIGPKTSQQLLPLLQGDRFESARQLAAFLGLTPCHKSSGTSLKSPGQLSGRGNGKLRSKLYMPAVSAIQWNPELRAFHDTLLARGKTEKQAIIAVMRKLVHLCYGVVKNQTPYQENYATLSG